MKLDVPTKVQHTVAEKLAGLREQDFGARLWEHDTTLWSHEPAEQAVIDGALGWLNVVEDVRGELTNLRLFADEARADGYTQAVLLGMGGSSLAPEVLRTTFGVANGYLDLHVLDTTDPVAIARLERALDLEHTLFIVSSKSGGTTETASFHAYFFDRVQRLMGHEAGRSFVAITDQGTDLQAQAIAQGFRAVFINPSDIGGRFSALSFFGLVPAALIGVDLERLLDRARECAEDCGFDVPVERNPGVLFGAALGTLAVNGRDKLTLITSTPITSFGAWAEQLIAESTGKRGTGILPVDREPLGVPAVYDDDRIFVFLKMGGSPAEECDRAVAALKKADFPVVTIEIHDLYEVGALFFLWEVAVATAGRLLGINPFDQPNVQESKDNTKRLLEELERRMSREAGGGQGGGGTEANGEAAALQGSGDPGGEGSVTFALGEAGIDAALTDFFTGVKRGGYVALQAFITPTDAAWNALQGARQLLLNRLHVATTAGFGPRFLHSTGQYHKGGRDNGYYLQLTSNLTAQGSSVGQDEPRAVDLPIPGQPYTFAQLKRAQALGDLRSLLSHGRRVLSVELGPDQDAGLTELLRLLDASVPQRPAP
jgi:glucose-6-phosphate isomerase